MFRLRTSLPLGFILLIPLPAPAPAQQPAAPPLPDIRQLMKEVDEHQKQMEKVRENYTFNTTQTTQDIDSNGQVKKTETEELEYFFVNSHAIGRTVKKNGKPLDDHEQQKETERVTKLVEKAEKLPPDKPLEEGNISVSRILEIMDVRNPRRDSFRGRPTILFDFSGRKDAKTHGLAEDVSKDLQGTIWIDEADRQVAHLEVSFMSDFHIAGGLFANIQKGSSFRFDQALVNSEIWLPTGGEGSMQARILLLKNLRQHFTERDYDYKKFHVEAEQEKGATVVPDKKP